MIFKFDHHAEMCMYLDALNGLGSCAENQTSCVKKERNIWQNLMATVIWYAPTTLERRCINHLTKCDKPTYAQRRWGTSAKLDGSILYNEVDEQSKGNEMISHNHQAIGNNERSDESLASPNTVRSSLPNVEEVTETPAPLYLYREQYAEVYSTIKALSWSRNED